MMYGVHAVGALGLSQPMHRKRKKCENADQTMSHFVVLSAGMG